MDKIDSKTLALIETELTALRMAMLSMLSLQPGGKMAAVEIRYWVNEHRSIHQQR